VPIPEWLVEIIGRRLEKNPEDRFQSASEVARLLEQHLAHVQRPGEGSLPEMYAKSAASVHGSTSPSRRMWPWVAACAVMLLAVIALTSQFANRVLGPNPADESSNPSGSSRNEFALENPMVDSTDESPKDNEIMPPPPPEYGSLGWNLLSRYALTIECPTGEVIRKDGSGTLRELSPGIYRVRLLQKHPNEVLREGTIEIEAATSQHISFRWDYPVLPMPAAPEAKATLHLPTGRVHAIAFSPDGRQFVFDHDNLRLWRMDGNEWTFEGECQSHSRVITGAVFSSDGRSLVSCSEDRRVVVWSVERKEVVRSLGPFEQMSDVALSPDGNLLAVGDSHCVKTGDWRSGLLLSDFFAHWEPVKDIVFSPDGRTIATSSMDYTAKLWNMPRPTVTGGDAGPTRVFTAMQHQSIGPKMAFGHDRPLIAIAGNSYKNLTIRDLSGHSVVKLFKRHPNQFESCSFLYDDTFVTREGVGHQRHLRLWEGIDFTIGGSVPCADAMWMRTSAETSLVALGLPNSVRILDPQAPDDSHYLTPANGSPSNIAFSRCGPLAVLGTDTGAISFWDTETGKQMGESIRHGNQKILSLAFSPDGTIVASSSADGSVKFWEAATREDSTPVPSIPEKTMAIDFSPDGRYLVTAGGEIDLNDEARRFYVAKVRLWDASTRELLAEFDGHLDCVMHAEFSHDGKLLATAGRDGKVHVWDVQDLIDYGARTNGDNKQ